MRDLIVLALITLAAAGCFDGNSDEVGSQSVLTTREGLLTVELRIDGHEESLAPFGRSSDGAIAVADDGTIAIRQEQDQGIRFFGRDGESDGVFGREGQGPGEFVNPGRIGWRADSLWIYDVRLGRVTVLAPSRELARTIRVRGDVRPRPEDVGRIPRAGFSLVVGLRPNDTFIRHALPFREDIPEDFGGDNFFAISDSAGTVLQVLARLSTEGRYVVASGSSTSVPFANVPVHAVSSDGGSIGIAHVDLDEPEPMLTVHLVGAEGATLFKRRFPVETVPLTGGARDSVFNAVATRLNNQELVDAVSARLDATEVFPPLRQMIVGRDGTVWIALAERDGTRPHLVLAADGEPLGRVELTGSSRIAEAEESRIWVIERDEYDVESLVRYRIDW